MAPEALEEFGPFVKRADGLGVGAVKHKAALPARANQANVMEHAKMLRDGWLAHAQPCHDVANGTLPIGEKDEDLPPARLGDGVEGV